MDTAFLREQIEAAQERLKHIQESLNESSIASNPLQHETIEELSFALEELHIVTEELYEKNIQLLATNQELEWQRQRYQDFFEFAPDPYLVTDPQGKILEANSAALTLLKTKTDFILGRSSIVFVAKQDRESFSTKLEQIGQWQQLKNWEIHLKPIKGFPIPTTISVSKIYKSQGVLFGLYWSIRNLTEQKLMEKQLRHIAFHDSLTGLPNRTLLLDRLGHALKCYQRNQQRLFALLFLDLDRFKAINDSLSHFAGDQILMETAAKLVECLRESDTVARLGGDEFVILLENIKGLEDAEICARRIQEKFAEPFHINNHQIVTSFSIGIVFSNSVYQETEELLRDADIAMYQAKKNGRSCYKIFQPHMHTHNLTFLHLEQELREAISKQQLRVFYQPIVSLEEKQINGFEALVRWEHPERGLISPGQFLPVAEETGLIVPLGWWVLEEACKQAVQWHAQAHLSKPLTVSVNLSNEQFTQTNTIPQVQEILEKTGLDPRLLKLEITEGVIAENLQWASKALAKLRELKVQLYIDDFGTGFSSLSRLRILPIDALKIDRSFISDGDGFKIVETIVTLAHNLGMQVIAEGVEKAEQVAQLNSLGCEYVQGYFYDRPLPADSVKLTMEL